MRQFGDSTWEGIKYINLGEKGAMIAFWRMALKVDFYLTPF